MKATDQESVLADKEEMTSRRHSERRHRTLTAREKASSRRVAWRRPAYAGGAFERIRRQRERIRQIEVRAFERCRKRSKRAAEVAETRPAA